MGKVFNIQKFCINDGPGIRTTVFLKGCPLNCAWCHNPESKTEATSVMLDFEKCSLCGRCAEKCTQKAHKIQNGHSFDRELCVACGECAEKCLNDAITLCGREMTADEVVAEVLKDKPFYESSGGGVTLSGGEPLLQFDFAYNILKACRENGVNTAVETCGFAEKEKILKFAEVTDIFLFDWKLSDSELHKKYTGVGNEIILNNLLALDSFGARLILRCPIIPGVNDTKSHFKGIASVANRLKNVCGIEILPYHSLGADKLKKLGKTDEMRFAEPQDSQVYEWIEAIKKDTEILVKRA